jgi:hypothetical protein
MRLLATVFLLLFVNQTQQLNPDTHPKKPGVSERDTQREAQNEEKQASDAAKCVGCVTIQQPNAETKQANAYDPRHDPLYRAYLGFTIFGVIVGLLGVGAIYSQTKATAQAAQATARSAQAAENSVGLLLRSERPWIIIRTTVKRDFQGNSFKFTLVNSGRTPANVISARTYHEIVPRNENHPTQPTGAPYTDVRDFGIVPPTKDGVKLDAMRLDEPVEEEFLEVRNGAQTFLRYIAIIYRNTLDEAMIHETKLVYRYDFMQQIFEPQHVKGYTKYS